MATPDLPLRGGCLCGAVRFEISEPLLRARYCHCTRCQRRTGTAASPGALIAPGALTILQGQEFIKAWDPGDGGFLKSFCVECGAHLFSNDPADPDVWNVRLGAIDGDPGIRPTERAYVNYAAVWEPIPDDGLVRYGEAR